MTRFLRVMLLMSAISLPAGAQALPAGKLPQTRWLFDFETGGDSGLGYKLPHIAAGTALERSVGKRLEFQGRLSYSPDKKYITNDGNSINMSTGVLFWVTDRLALYGDIGKSYLWTSQFNKSATFPSVGVVFRDHLGGVPGRLYISYFLPTGCQWGANCPIQSSRLQGPETYWEHRLWPRFRLGFSIGVYHILNQSNQMEPNIPRKGL